MSTKFIALFTSLTIGFLIAIAGVSAQPPTNERIRPTFPHVRIAEPQSHGQAAVNRLGSKLADVANWYGKSPDAFKKQLLSDHNVRIDGHGRMFVVEELEAPIGSSTAEPSAVIDGQLSPLDQTFKLHSRPGANKTIYLDFDGATITGTVWNNGSVINAPPYDFDGNTASFSTLELERIQYIWQRVAEDYAPFDVDVTTEAPTPDQITRTDVSDQIFGTTIVITTTTGVYNCSCGGIAYVGVFNDTNDYLKPAFVFYNKLSGGAEKPVAEAISHEAGHNVGLSHDGASNTTYYGGQGTDPVTGWAPIMGVGYGKPLVQFSKGEYTGANNKEDDYAVMQSYALPLRIDDYGNSVGTASSLPNSGTVDGVIEKAGDRDVFVFAAGAGLFSASVSPAYRSANADLTLTLLDAAGTVLVTSNLLNALNAEITYQLPQKGTYYLAVGATGQGDPAVTGYSDYASVGNYRVVANFQPDGNPPQAVLTASATSGVAPATFTFDGSNSTDSDGLIKFYYWDFGDGTGDSIGTSKSVTKTYSASGTYIVQLRVVDNAGLSSVATATVTVTDPPVVNTVSVQSIQLTLRKVARGVRSNATVTVINQLGQPVPGAVVTANWSGIVSSSLTATTNTSGTALFTSPTTKKTGCYIFTVTNITLAGYTFDSSKTPTTAQICRVRKR